MRLLDRYLLRELMVPLAYCLGGFLLFWITFDLFGTLALFQEAHLSAAEIAEFYLVKVPELLVVVAPIALLLAQLYSLTKHSRHHEIIAMRAAGLSLWRISAPYLAVGFLFSIILFFLNEVLAPESMERAAGILARHRQEAGTTQAWKSNIHFRNARDGRIWNIGSFNTETFEMKDPHVEWAEGSSSRRQLMARQGVRTNGVWVFHDAQIYDYAANIKIEDYKPIRTNIIVLPELTETPEDIKVQIKFSRLSSIDASKKPQLSLAEIRYLKSHLDLNRRDRALLETQWHARLAQPWTCPVVVLIAFSFGVTSGRKNVFVGVASSIFIVFVFFILQRFGLAFGNSGLIPGWLAGWLPNLAFGSAGLFFMRRMI